MASRPDEILKSSVCDVLSLGKREIEGEEGGEDRVGCAGRTKWGLGDGCARDQITNSSKGPFSHCSSFPHSSQGIVPKNYTI
ncbi:unnamed protein product [Prunus armeniaca]|uniref:Uncharacterized protein n=1 Tax=Prunus armeniaca TaxID=36596 RepID=A0A6J5UV84_PRUAR|nr:unnamed protein product [Prunus armeniaca]